MTTTATASWGLDVLVSSLARAGGGPLAGHQRGVSVTLRALADVLPHGSADGRTIAADLAKVGGVSERTIRAGLTVLESLGLISWQRGRKWVASRIRVCKRTLARWVRDARMRRTPAASDPRPAPVRRPGRGRRSPGGRPQQPPRPAGPGRPRSARSQPEMVSGPHPFGGVTAVPVTVPGEISTLIGACRAALRRRR